MKLKDKAEIWRREKARRECLRHAVWECCRKGFDVRAIAAALQVTRERVKQLFYMEARARGDSKHEHRWNSGEKFIEGAMRRTLTCQKCTRVEYWNGKWKELQKGRITYPFAP